MKRASYLLTTFILIFFTVVILNLNVTTKQCINYDCLANKIPLYLKILGFFERHYEYKHLVNHIVKDARSDEERVMKILEWTFSNIRRAPHGFPVIDDHVWYIIVRGYGTSDQFQDVFTTFCNYSKINALYRTFKINNSPETLSFVKLKNNWHVFDAYHGIYFKNSKGKIADINDLMSGDWIVFRLSNNIEIPAYYGECFKSLNSINYENYKLSRPSIQSPVNRIRFWNKYKK